MGMYGILNLKTPFLKTVSMLKNQFYLQNHMATKTAHAGFSANVTQIGKIITIRKFLSINFKNWAFVAELNNFLRTEG